MNQYLHTQIYKVINLKTWLLLKKYKHGKSDKGNAKHTKKIVNFTFFGEGAEKIEIGYEKPKIVCIDRKSTIYQIIDYFSCCFEYTTKKNYLSVRVDRNGNEVKLFESSCMIKSRKQTLVLPEMLINIKNFFIFSQENVS